MNTGCVLKMDKVGNNFNLFFNGELKRTFTETGKRAWQHPFHDRSMARPVQL